MSTDILARIQAQLHTFSKGQKRIANYILESYDKACLLYTSRRDHHPRDQGLHWLRLRRLRLCHEQQAARQLLRRRRGRLRQDHAHRISDLSLIHI